MVTTNTVRYVSAGVAAAAAMTLVIALVADRLAMFEIIGPTAPLQYPWRLTDPTVGGQISVWLGYVAHNLFVWWVIYKAKASGQGFKDKFTSFNWMMLWGNGAFIGLHLLQTHVFYDGLARDVPEVTAQGSVALMLIVILLFEAPRRGLAFGRLRIDRKFTEIARQYHGYLFSWAIIYTFWYHPMVSTQGHLIGFFYMFMLIWQSVLILNRAHINRWWTLALEAMVVPHAILVAVTQPSNAWRMFGFGFLTIFVLTQMHGVGLSRTVRVTLGSTFAVALVLAYGVYGDVSQWNEVLRIPIVEYLVVALLYGIFAIVVRFAPGRSSTNPAPAEA